MKTKEQRTQAANDLLTVVVSFVLYMTMLLILVAIQGQVEEGTGPPMPRDWAMQRILALLLLILAAGHLIGSRIVADQRKLRLQLTAAEVLSAASLFLLAPNAWMWLALAAGAFGSWAFCFQTAVLEFLEPPETEAEQDSAPDQPEPAGAGTEPGRPGRPRSDKDDYDDSRLHV